MTDETNTGAAGNDKQTTEGVAANTGNVTTDPQAPGNGPADVKPAAGAADTGGPIDPNAKPHGEMSPMEKAVAGGYKEEPQPSREERAAAVVAELEHAVKHNGPVTLAVVKEIRELLDVPAPADESEVEADSDVADD